VKAAALLRNRGRLFWFLNVAGWTGYTLAAWLGALAHEKPESYSAVIIATAVAGFLASLRADVAFNARWSLGSLVQYDNTAELVGINSRLRYMPEAGKELVLLLNHGLAVDSEHRLSTTQSDLNLKLSYTFRY
jgi:hypothetical protein